MKIVVSRQWSVVSPESATFAFKVRHEASGCLYAIKLLLSHNNKTDCMQVWFPLFFLTRLSQFNVYS